MSLRVAYMTGEYPRATDVFIQREVAALRAQGVHVETFSVRKPAEKEFVGPEQKAERDRTYFVLPACPWNVLKAHASLLFGSPGRYFSGLRLAMKTRSPGLKALVWQVAYFVEAGLVANRVRSHQLVHLHNHFSNSSCSVAMLAAEIGGFTFSFTMHGPLEFFEAKYWRLDEKCRRAKLVICTSWYSRSQGMIFAPPEAWGHMRMLHCGVDPAAYDPRPHQGRATRLLFVGRLAPVKGIAVLLEAFAQLCRNSPDTELSLAGDGPDRQRLEAQAKELGIADRVRFLGYQTQSQVKDLLREADVFVLSSFAEGLPTVLMEAMAAGVPVVGTRIAGVEDLVEDGVCGIVVPPANVDALADAIESLIEDPVLRNQYAAAAREQIAREFDLTTQTQLLAQTMIDALEGRLAPARSEVPAEAPAV